MHSKSDNIEIMINDETDKIIENRFELLFHRYQIGLGLILAFIVFIYCIINVIK